MNNNRVTIHRCHLDYTSLALSSSRFFTHTHTPFFSNLQRPNHDQQSRLCPSCVWCFRVAKIAMALPLLPILLIQVDLPTLAPTLTPPPILRKRKGWIWGKRRKVHKGSIRGVKRSATHTHRERDTHTDTHARKRIILDRFFSLIITVGHQPVSRC